MTKKGRIRAAYLSSLSGLLLASFAASAQTSAAELFARGLTALHHFEYEDANAAFVQARGIDPAFVMAYWGEALTYYQPLWRNENVEAGRQALARLGPTSAARAAATANAPDRDKELFRTAEILFGEGDAATRHRRYREAMAGVAAHFPRDPDVVSLYALALLGSTSRSLIGTSDPRVDGLAGSSLQKEVAALLQKVLDAHPQHPGALHYLLHTYDDPAHAAMALPAAKTYASIAGKASHALHMPAHIYLQLGQWHEAAASDRAAYDASVEWVERQHLPAALRNYHALGWLQYELLQLGRYGEARDTLQQLAPVVNAAPTSGSHNGTHQPLLSDLSSMRARYVVETRQWQAMAGVTTFGNVNDLFAIGMAAAYAKNIDAARTVRQTLAARKQAPEEGDLRPAIAIMELELAALIARAGGAGGEALDILRAAARDEQALPPPLGLPTPIKPAAELLGEVLLEAGRGREAYDAFDVVLKRHPNRSLAVLGQARAAVQLGNAATARRHYQQLLQNYRRADASLPELLEARSATQRR